MINNKEIEEYNKNIDEENEKADAENDLWDELIELEKETSLKKVKILERMKALWQRD